jgi:hypothetical protein
MNAPSRLDVLESLFSFRNKYVPEAAIVKYVKYNRFIARGKGKIKRMAVFMGESAPISPSAISGYPAPYIFGTQSGS